MSIYEWTAEIELLVMISMEHMVFNQRNALSCDHRDLVDCDRCLNLIRDQILQLPFNGDNLSPFPYFCIEQSRQKIIVRPIVSQFDRQYLLISEEQKLQSFSVSGLELLGLTKREAEVLFWVAKDKSNAAIAKVIGCSEGTVRKHLENLYEKLNVQTRTGAVMVVLEKLGLLENGFMTRPSYEVSKT